MPTSPFNQGPNINNAIEPRLLIINAIEPKLLIINAIKPKLLIINAIRPMLLTLVMQCMLMAKHTLICWGHIPYDQPNVNRFVFCIFF